MGLSYANRVFEALLQELAGSHFGAPNDKLSCRAAPANPSLFVWSEQFELSWPLRSQLQRHVSRFVPYWPYP